MSFVTEGTGSFFTGSAKVDANVSPLPAQNKFTADEANQIHDALMNLRSQFVDNTELGYFTISGSGVTDSGMIDFNVDSDIGGGRVEVTNSLGNPGNFRVGARNFRVTTDDEVVYNFSENQVGQLITGLEIYHGPASADVERDFGIAILPQQDNPNQYGTVVIKNNWEYDTGEGLIRIDGGKLEMTGAQEGNIHLALTVGAMGWGNSELSSSDSLTLKADGNIQLSSSLGGAIQLDAFSDINMNAADGGGLINMNADVVSLGWFTYLPPIDISASAAIEGRVWRGTDGRLRYAPADGVIRFIVTGSV